MDICHSQIYPTSTLIVLYNPQHSQKIYSVKQYIYSNDQNFNSSHYVICKKNTFCYTLKDNVGAFKAAIISALSCDKDETITFNAQDAEIYISLYQVKPDIILQ